MNTFKHEEMDQSGLRCSMRDDYDPSDEEMKVWNEELDSQKSLKEQGDPHCCNCDYVGHAVTQIGDLTYCEDCADHYRDGFFRES